MTCVLPDGISILVDGDLMTIKPILKCSSTLSNKLSFTRIDGENTKPVWYVSSFRGHGRNKLIDIILLLYNFTAIFYKE